MASTNFHNRINYDGELSDLMDIVANEYSLGSVRSYSVIEMGFEDLNIRLETSGGEYVIKVFSKDRTDTQIERFVETIKRAIIVGVNHPKLLTTREGSYLFNKDVGVQLIAMLHVQGKTFYDLSRPPSNDELLMICAEAVKIHSMQYEPEYIFDSWAIPNMKWMYEKTKDHLSAEGLRLVQKTLDLYESIPVDDLPKCFVHGDLIKTNLILGDDNTIYVLDFAVSNVYPRIQELAVMAANLLFDERTESAIPLRDRVNMVIDTYAAAGGKLTPIETDNIMNYALPGAAMEYMGSVNERIVGDTSKEIQYWEKLGLETLREALG